MTPSNTSLIELKTQLEYYCVYQERCHDEVEQKLKLLNVSKNDFEAVIIHLIEHDFLNETRFACSYVRGKHRIKHWGRIRIVNELKFRHISKFNIDLALKEIDEQEYQTTFDELAERQWEICTEKNMMKKQKKVSDFLLRKGYESEWVYGKIRSLRDEDR